MTSVYIQDAIVGERDGFVDVVIFLDAPSTTLIEMFISTSSASAGSVDYLAQSKFVSFAPGEVRKTVRFEILDDNIPESKESFYVSGSFTRGGQGATFLRADAVVTIVDNDQSVGIPTATVHDVAIDENDHEVVFNVILDRPSNSQVLMEYTTRDFTAFAGSDYEATSGLMAFFPGETVKTVRVPLIKDSLN